MERRVLTQADVHRLPLADGSVHMIFTDPPYHEKYLHLYSWLSKEASRVLKDGGFCLVMSGGYHLDRVMRRMGRHLKFFWKFEEFMANVSTVIWPRRVIAKSKSILAYTKGDGMPRCNVLGAMVGGGNDKRFHHWGQDVESARYYIDCLTEVGQMVLDPFCGGGTTLVACELLDRRGVGFDLDISAVLSTRNRLANGQFPAQGGMFDSPYGIDINQ